MKKALIIIVSIIVVVLAIGVILLRPVYQKLIAVETIKYDPQLTIYTGGGGNSIVLTSEDGTKALIVDTKMGGAAKDLKNSVKAGEIIIASTHSHSDHTGGNSLYPSAKIIAGAYTREQWDIDSGKSRYPDVLLKAGEEKIIRIGTEKVHIRNVGPAHTMNDLVVYFENRKFLAAGDLIFLDMHPALLTKSGSNVKLWIGALGDLYNRYNVKTLLPGHGKVSDRTALIVMKDYFVSIGDSIGNPEKQAELKKKYKDYFSLPFMSGFDKTLKYIENEKKGR
jgi:glyoxylase-like metal-dependent hydrolase (beta-lactamase superfamily II)